MKPKLTRRDNAEIRRLRAAMGVEGPGRRWIGLLLGVLVASAAGALILLTMIGGGPPVIVYGAVQGFGLVETDYGSRPSAQVWVDDRAAQVLITRATTCRVGDRIKLHRRRGLLGYRYLPALPSPCG